MRTTTHKEPETMTERSEDRILDSGDRVLIITRRLFPDDVQRHFVGMVDRATQNAILVHGYTFVRDTAQGEFVRRKSQRSRVFPLDNHIVIYVLPYDTDIKLVLIDISEFGIGD
jgi:hypothetical protein